MTKYKRKNKTITIEAIQFLNIFDASKFCRDKIKILLDKDYVELETQMGVMKVNKGDYIIKLSTEQFYPCGKEVFEQTYEKL